MPVRKKIVDTTQSMLPLTKRLMQMRDSDKSSDAEEVENFAGEIKRTTRIPTIQIFCLRCSRNLRV
jgi:hypothetical protein